MKNKVTYLAVALLLALALSLTACASDYGDKMMGGWDSSYAPSDGDGYYGGEGDADIADGDEEQEIQQRPQYIKKQLTAAAWKDADKYEYWTSLFSQGDEQTRAGIFSGYSDESRGLDTRGMREIKVTCGGEPVAGAKVKLYEGESVLFTAVTDARGIAYVFGENATAVSAHSGDHSVRYPLSQSDSTVLELNAALAKSNVVELMFVVDTTGSMGDELDFLKDELYGVINRIVNSIDARVRLGMLFYRDKGDDYITRCFDFADVSDASGLESAVTYLGRQTAAGGGDTPEAVDTALSEAVGKQWQSGTSTKLLFHILDAPYHDKAEYRKNFSRAVYSAAEKGIRIIPVAASGLDTLGQYIMRSAALLTGGTYAFLTDDSGIGNPHETPDVESFTVEYLSDLMVRLVTGYYTGIMPKPVDWRQSSEIAK